MKKLLFYFLTLSLLLTVSYACKDKDDPITEKGTLESATYNHTTKSFTLTYSSGQNETVNAVIDNTSDTPTAIATLTDGTIVYVADASVSGNATISKEINVVSQFVYDGLSTYYFWADEVQSKTPKITDVNPSNYFYKILNATDTQHGWSWITDDVDALLAGFEGQSLSFGYDLGFTILNNVVYAYIKYVYAGTPAEKAGLKRLDLIGKLNGQPIRTVQRDGGTYISSADVDLLYGNNAVKFTVYQYSGTQIVQDKEVTITPDNSAKDPVLYENIYQIGTKKIGYLFYTDFYDNYNNRLYEVFSKFKQNGVTDLVLDLRYNTGGAVSSAIYLASMIAPRTNVENKEPFVVMNYNNLLNTSFDKWYNDAKPEDKYKYDRKDYLGVYNSVKDQNPLNANLNLNKVYIIATGNSYSASELTTFCLEPYMDVVHIGGNTGGKYTASWTIHGYDSFEDNEGNSRAIPLYDETKLTSTEKIQLKNWAMQPIVAMYANKKGDSFDNPGYLKPDPDCEMNEGFGLLSNWTPLGDTKDVFLGQALYLISGDENYKPVQTRYTRALTENIAIRGSEDGKPVIIENKLTADDFQKIRELRK